MARIDFGIDGVGAEAAGGNYYDGDTPPKGNYQGVLKRLVLKKNAKGAHMLNGLVELKAPKAAKGKKSKSAQYDGYGVWFNQNVTEQGKGYVNQFLNALVPDSEVARKKVQKDFWGGKVVVDDENHITKIGALKVSSPDGNIVVALSGKRGTGEYSDQLQVATWLIRKNASDDDDEEGIDEDEDEEDEDLEDEDLEDDEDDEDEDSDDEDEDDDDEEDEDEDDDEGGEEEDEDEDEDEEDGEDEDDEDDEEDEEPVEPVKTKKTAKKTPAKKTAVKKGKALF